MPSRALSWAITLALAPCAVLPASTWQIDPMHTNVSFSVRHLMISNVRGTFHGVAGTIEYDPKELSKASVQVTIQTSGVDTGVEPRDRDLRSPSFLDVQRYPLMTFRSTKVTPAGEKTAKIAGELSIRGLPRPVTIEAELLGTVSDPKVGSRAGFTGRTSINRKDFGLTWSKGLDTGGAIIGDEVTIELEVEAVEKKAAPSSGGRR